MRPSRFGTWHSNNFSSLMNGFGLRCRTMMYPYALGLRVGIEGLEPEHNADALSAVLVTLDTALGKRAAALEIQHVEVSSLPSSPESLGYFELHALPNYLS